MRLLFKRGRGESARRSTRSGLRELKVFSLYRSRAPSGRSTRCPVRPIKLIEREAREPFELSDLDSLRDFQLDQIVSRELSQLGQPRGMRGMRGSRRPLGKVREGRTSLDREKLLGERTGKTDPPEQPPLWFSRRGGGGPSDSRGRSPPRGELEGSLGLGAGGGPRSAPSRGAGRLQRMGSPRIVEEGWERTSSPHPPRSPPPRLWGLHGGLHGDRQGGGAPPAGGRRLGSPSTPSSPELDEGAS